MLMERLLMIKQQTESWETQGIIEDHVRLEYTG